MAITQILGKKIGTTQVFREDGSADCVTAIQVSPCTVTQIKSSSIDGYESVQLGFETIKKSTKPKIGHFKKSSDELFRYLREVRSDGTEDINIGDKFDSSIFEPGERLNVTGISKGRGFQGGVKRHHFRGGPKTHGQSDRHRAPGSIGAGTSPGKVLKGLKMAGHKGNVKVTVKNLEVVSVDVEKNAVLVKGAVPGARQGLLLLSKRGK